MSGGTPYLSIKSSALKVALGAFMKVGAYALLGIVILVILQYQVGLDIFVDIAKDLGVEVSINQILPILVMALIGITVIFALFSILLNTGQSMDFYDQALTFGNFQAAYLNVTRVSFNNDGVAYTVTKSGSIKLEFTGLNKDFIEIKWVSQPELFVQQITQLVNREKQRAQQPTLNQVYSGLVQKHMVN